ncbi:MAG: hypothetical protein QOF26_2886 [Baekduia sp.]|jgi:hypothetical protein|nr:hypothetical protein [Baekduia sp.]
MCHPMMSAMNRFPDLEAGEPAPAPDRIRLVAEGRTPVEGVVDLATPEFLGVRTPDGRYRLVVVPHDDLLPTGAGGPS